MAEMVVKGVDEMILLRMEEILNHLGFIKPVQNIVRKNYPSKIMENPVNNGINYQPQLVIAGFLLSTDEALRLVCEPR